MKKVITPIKYFGGKSNMLNKILEHFPIEFNTYIEPFGGSYSIGLAMENTPPVEIYNDLERNVYSLYKTLSDEVLFKEFKNKCDLIYYSDDLRKEFKLKLKNEDLTILERAFYFFYVNRTSHNGIGGFSKNIIVRRNMSKSVYDFLSSIDRLPEIHQRLSKVIVSNCDGLDLIKKYNKEDVFFYLDPPYEQSTRTLTRYEVDMDNKKHIEFLNLVIESKSKMLISGYDCELYDILEKNNFIKIPFEVKTITGNFEQKTKIETLWKNY